MSKKICVFDVDGIIVDSTDECLVIAWNAYQEYSGKSNLIKSISDAEPYFSKKFRLTRNYVRAMGEYLVVFESQYNKIDSQNDFERKLSKLENNHIQTYGEFFLKNRNEFKKKNYISWLSMHRYYDGIISVLTKCDKESELYIVTGKDRDSSLELLSKIGIEVGVEKIFHMNLSINKLESLKKIAAIEKVPYSRVHFIDDNFTHLKAPQKEGFTVALGEWGYALPEHVDLAIKHHMPVLSLNEVSDFMLL
tara:strand:+ start:1634 stop:2383 length:750 start_codon:yes stop_codon:yes gene_type:complete